MFDITDTADSFVVEMLSLDLDSYDSKTEGRRSILATVPKTEMVDDLDAYIKKVKAADKQRKTKAANVFEKQGKTTKQKKKKRQTADDVIAELGGGVDQKTIDLTRIPKGDAKGQSPHFFATGDTTVYQADMLHITDDQGFKYLLVVVDVATKETDAVPLKNIQTATVKKALQYMWSSHGKTYKGKVPSSNDQPVGK
eukprot:gene33139-biopygen24722